MRRKEELTIEVFEMWLKKRVPRMSSELVRQKDLVRVDQTTAEGEGRQQNAARSKEMEDLDEEEETVCFYIGEVEGRGRRGRRKHEWIDNISH